MDVLEAVASRYSCRAFRPTPVPEMTVRDILERAARAPSAGNMQPWRIFALAGERIEALKMELAARTNELPKGEGGNYQIYPDPMTEPYRTRRFTVGELLYRSIKSRARIKLGVIGNTHGTINSSARRSQFSLPSIGRLASRNGPTSAAICRPLCCSRALMVFIRVRSKLG